MPGEGEPWDLLELGTAIGFGVPQVWNNIASTNAESDFKKFKPAMERADKQMRDEKARREKRYNERREAEAFYRKNGIQSRKDQ